MKDILPELNKRFYTTFTRGFDIGFCTVEDIDLLVDFIKKHWNENHILTKSRRLLDWQHYDRVNNRYNAVIAKRKTTGEIYSVLMFIPNRQFDANIKHLLSWGALWKARDDLDGKGLGIILYYFLKENLPIETIAGLGISDKAQRVLRSLNFTMGKTSQWYLLNKNKTKFSLVKNVAPHSFCGSVSDSAFEEINEDTFNFLDSSIFCFNTRYKSKEFYRNRFLRHPTYTYHMAKIEDKSKNVLILVFRICRAKNANAIRIVDFAGDINLLSGMQNHLQCLLERYDAEYIDFICALINTEALKGAGFLNRTDTGAGLPTYFEPFLPDSIDLDFAYKTISDAKPLFVKADADQDRPNL